MRDDTTHEDRLRQRPTPKGLGEILQTKDEESEVEETSSSRPFGYLRGIQDYSAAVEFKFRSGNSIWFPFSDGAVTLMHAGFQRRRLTYVREMSEEEIRNVGPTEPTIDSIEVEEFESHAALKEWLAKKAPAFAT